MPVLSDMAKSGSLSGVEIIGISRREVDADQLATSSVGDDALLGRINVITMDLARPDDYVRLKQRLNLDDNTQALMYLSVPPGASAQIADLLGEAGLNTQNVKLLFEKPFGFDHDSASDFINRTSQYFNERQIYRIDHYMAKDVAQSLIDFKTKSEDHKKWNSQAVKSIKIEATESIDVENRAAFYEQTGALRDVLQGHLMQLLAITLMHIDDDFTLDNLPKYRLDALNKIVPANPELTIRGQYAGYDQEVDNPGSLVETFVSTKLESADDQWRGTEISLTTGKAMNKKSTSITVTYKDGSIDVFEEGGASGGNYPNAYEHVLLEAIKGSKSIFTTSDEVIRSWEVLAPIQEAWNMSDEQPKKYHRGSSVEDIIAA